ncbi:agamous-like MADS-box protein AGL62 [Alnus glutinosa]|uniref:agamous-like MADS-box protein AGL62 n=1 Tax=Alnus glutinosa TaxID=3517 RepID=UPI002D79417F|nr:agamous-like MADS-box protein AGL62 [Alnus glutinosa]
MVKKNPSMGRKKTASTKIQTKSHLQVTFSKRRSGVFKKASELCTLCGVEIAMIVFSPGNKVFSFGHPTVESILDRFLSSGNPPPEYSKRHDQLVEAHRNYNIHELNLHLTGILNQLEAEKKHGDSLDQMRRANQREYWWEAPVDELGLHELEQMRVSMEELKKSVAKKQANKTTEMNGGFLESKPAEISAALPFIIPNGYNFGYGHLLY